MRWLILLLLLAPPVRAETLVASGAIRAMSLIGPADLALVEGETPGALGDPSEAIGMEARVNLYPGRPIRAADLQPPAVIDRNDIITLQFNQGGLLIVTEGRAMDRAGVGARIRVINLGSRTTVTATVVSAGLAEVGPGS
ncbi:MAG: flagella basal body P-ring formation protein FlgA [Rhodobacteraceae bacterium CG17_big_fil_post_rev_8_21_14_2_50_65_11]|nr:MAG: flagella basal body P-ring formation protein FlgA [Rhodobacteraceae bacterium CG17_big_fil_post_rev_8_21_14_2_50_65_11]